LVKFGSVEFEMKQTVKTILSKSAASVRIYDQHVSFLGT